MRSIRTLTHLMAGQETVPGPVVLSTQTRFANTLPDFVAARARCSAACRAYNELSDDAPHQEIVQRWLDIVDPARVYHSLPHPCTATDLGTLKSGGSSSGNSPDLEHARSLSLAPTMPLLGVVAPKVKKPIIMEYGLRVRVHPTAFINFNCTILDTPVADIVIGARALIGPNVGLYAVSHSMAVDPNSGYRSIEGRGIIIEDRVWIGGDSIVLAGIKIGHDSVIGARSLVTKDIPPLSLAVGSPAKVIRKIDPQEEAPNPDDYEAKSLHEALMIGQDGSAVSYDNLLAVAASVSECLDAQNGGSMNR